ncbi:MAG TPA: adenylate/guanylate cyclase domain-containing protein [Candidatus Dormibacteraeota bacterium]|nr:adenylate/guanylate cyclase domain-containing protein [Candidatus Dormibacteraeota bacterium]
MICPSCGAAAKPEGRFCFKCGTKLGRSCANCGAALEAADAFCAACGVAAVPDHPQVGSPAPAVAASSSRPDAQLPTTERRVVSVLFADLVGFTTLSEQRDAEEVRELLSAYFDGCRSIIESYGGTIEKFIGDAVMAVWGAPVANEDDAERAVRAALDLVEQVAALGTRMAVSGLQARAAVLTGEAAVNLGAAGQGMVAGDLVNTASRLQAAAEPGSVVVGESTRQAASLAVTFADLGELHLKGRLEPVRAWRALRVVGQRRGLGSEGRPEPPFTGRGEELRLLKELLQATGRERRPRLVSITGVPGIGKSRLAWELQKYADGVAETVYWHQGRCPAYGDGISFWALGEMVRMRAGIAESEEPPVALPKLEATVAEFCSDPQEVSWVLPRLAHLLGLDEAPPGGPEELFSAWRTLFERIADRGTTVLVIEDLQWADQGLIDFVESIPEWLRSLPILILTLSRPELMERRPTWGAHQRSFVSLHLDPLSDQATEELLHGLVQGLPASLLERLRQQAEGVPLYAVETVRMLVDRGVLVERDGAYEVVGRLADLEIPQSLHALIQSRLDALPPSQRSLLQDAAVLGKTFSPEALAAVSGGDLVSLQGQLQELVKKELLSVDSDPRSPQRGQFGFVQGLIREVAYGTIARRDRVSKHLAGAGYFQSTGEEELAGVVANHYLEAYRAAPSAPEAEQIAARAQEQLQLAGQRALALGSPEQALTFFEHALEVAQEGRAKALLQDLAGDAAGEASQLDLAISHYEAALAFYVTQGDQVAQALTTARITVQLAGLDRYPEAIRRAEESFQALGEEGDARARAQLAVELASAYDLSGDPQAGLLWSERCLELAGSLEDESLLLQALDQRVFAVFSLGRHAEALLIARAAANFADSSAGPLDQAKAVQLLTVCTIADDPKEAVKLSLRCADLARRGGRRSVEVISLLNAAEQAIYVAEWSTADRILQGLEGRQLRDSEHAFRGCCQAILLALRQDPGQARRQLEEMAPQMGEMLYQSGRLTYVKARAMVALTQGELELAQREARDLVSEEAAGMNSLHALSIQARAALWMRDREGALEVERRLGSFRGRWANACALTVSAGLLALGPEGELALAAYQKAISAWREMELPLDLGLCLLDRVALQGPDGEGSKEAAREARAIFTEIGSVTLLEKLEQVAPVPIPA